MQCQNSISLTHKKPVTHVVTEKYPNPEQKFMNVTTKIVDI